MVLGDESSQSPLLSAGGGRGLLPSPVRAGGTSDMTIGDLDNWTLLSGETSDMPMISLRVML